MTRYLVGCGIMVSVFVAAIDALAVGARAEEQLEEALAIIEHQETNLSRLKLEYDVHEVQADLKNVTSGSLERLSWQHSLIVDGERRDMFFNSPLQPVGRHIIRSDEHHLPVNFLFITSVDDGLQICPTNRNKGTYTNLIEHFVYLREPGSPKGVTLRDTAGIFKFHKSLP